MDKLFSVKYLFLMILMCFTLQAQKNVSNNKQFTEKDIQIDTSKTQITPFTKDYQQRYNSDDFDYTEKKLEEGFWERFKRWFFGKVQQLLGNSDPNKTANTIEIIFKVIAFLVIAYAVYIIVRVILNKEGNWVFGKSTTKKIIQHQDIERNLQNVDFEKLIKDTLKQGNNRLVIRYYYLWLLKKMSEKAIIDWNIEKTNSDYLYEIKITQLREDFSYASYLYDYIWYGEFELDQNTFEIAQNKFEKTLRSI